MQRELLTYFIFYMNIFVAKLDYGVNSDDLKEVFENYGTVSSCNVIMDRETGRSKGFGFVEMDNEEEAMNAINGLNATSIRGREIVVKKAEPRNR